MDKNGLKMPKGRGNRRATKSKGFPPVTLATLEPYAVAFTLVSGGISALGCPLGSVPALVVMCWFLFLVTASETPAKPRLRGLLPAFLSAVAGIAIFLLPMIPLGLRYASFAWLAAGLSWLLLPRPGSQWIGWSLRTGG